MNADLVVCLVFDLFPANEIKSFSFLIKAASSVEQALAPLCAIWGYFTKKDYATAPKKTSFKKD